MRSVRSTMLSLVFLVAACGGGTETTTYPEGGGGGGTGGGGGGGGAGGGGAGGGSTGNQITVADNSFDPSALTVAVGTTVTWTWQGGYSEHTVTFLNTALGGSAQQTTGTYAKTFPTAGTFGYQCKVHGAAMAGTITVQ